MCADILRTLDVSEFTGEISPQAWQRMRDEHEVPAAISRWRNGDDASGRKPTHCSRWIGGAQ